MPMREEHSDFQDLLRRFLEDHVTPAYRRERISRGIHSDPELWGEIEKLGIQEGFSSAAPLFTIEDAGLLAEECGRALMPEPVVERLIAEQIAVQCMTADERKSYECAWKAGATALAFRSCCALTVDRKKHTASGTIEWAIGCQGAERLLAFADTHEGPRAIILSTSTKEVSASPTQSLDLTTALTRITLTKAPVLVLGADTTAAIEETIEALKACEVAGLCRKVIEITCEYVRTREQFGLPVGAFQAVQQKLADIYAHSESLHALARFATWSAVHSTEQRALTARAAATLAAEVGTRVCEVSLQCHGGIGFTWEYDLHLYLRRAKMIQSAFALTEKRAAELLSSVS